MAESDIENKDKDTMIRTLLTLVEERGKNESLYKGFIVILLLSFISIIILTYLSDRRQHDYDNVERAKHWQTIEDRLKFNASGIKSNGEQIQLFDEHLRQCANCHTQGIHATLLRNWNKKK